MCSDLAGCEGRAQDGPGETIAREQSCHLGSPAAPRMSRCLRMDWIRIALALGKRDL